jgi:hypothetical protein
VGRLRFGELWAGGGLVGNRAHDEGMGMINDSCFFVVFLLCFF